MDKKKVFIIALTSLFLITGAFSVLVNYLSNETNMSVEVESPITLLVKSNDEWVQTPEVLDLGTIYGGDTLETSFKEINNNPATKSGGSILVTIYNEDGISLEEIESILVTEYLYNNGDNDCNGGIRYSDMDVSSNLVQKNVRTLTLTLPTVLLENQNCVSFDTKTTFASNSLGNHDISVQIVPSVE